MPENGEKQMEPSIDPSFMTLVQHFAIMAQFGTSALQHLSRYLPPSLPDACDTEEEEKKSSWSWRPTSKARVVRDETMQPANFGDLGVVNVKILAHLIDSNEEGGHTETELAEVAHGKLLSKESPLVWTDIVMPNFRYRLTLLTVLNLIKTVDTFGLGRMDEQEAEPRYLPAPLAYELARHYSQHHQKYDRILAKTLSEIKAYESQQKR